MIKKTVYVCEKCGKSYYNKLECSRCEKSHEEELRHKIYSSCYHYSDEYDLNYPFAITVMFEDGKIINYKRG